MSRLHGKSWGNRYTHLAKEISTWSKDPSTQVGAVVIGNNGEVLSQGYNGFPRGIKDTSARLKNRERKYNLVVHAEMNAIYNASLNGVSLNNATLYVYGLPICNECAKGIIQTGIKRVVMSNIDGGMDRWKESWEATQEMFAEAGIEWEIIGV